ncbi:MAG: YcgN family cysteine cluster protein [Rhodomicrobium sp.]
MESETPFWRTKTLEQMTAKEWESLCDGCGQCCLIKLEDEDTGDIAVTRLACKLLNIGTCRCSDYDNRRTHVEDCLQLTPSDAHHLTWLPGTCAYRLVAEGRDLSWWHPLVSGSPETVHEAGVSIRGAALSETKVRQERYPAHIVGWIKRRKRK